jgi:hypothetical protein
LLLSVLLIVVGIQFVTFGLISQMLVSTRHAQSRSPLPFGVVRELGAGEDETG